MPNENNGTEKVYGKPDYKKEPRGNIILYIVISVALFFLLFFGKRAISGFDDRDYFISARGKLTSEKITAAQSLTEISADISGARLDKIGAEGLVSFVYADIGDAEEFIGESVGFGLSNPEEDMRVKIYPDYDNTAEYAFAEVYVNTENPKISLLIYDYDGLTYAEFRSNKITVELSQFFSDYDKIYE